MKTVRSQITFDKNGLSVRQLPVDSFVKNIVSRPMCCIVSRFSHHSTLAALPAGRWGSGTFQREYYCALIPPNEINAVRHCRILSWNWYSIQASPSTQPSLQGGQFSLMVIGMLGLLTWPKSGNQFIVLITDQFCKLTVAFRTPKLTSTKVAPILLNKSVIPNEISDNLLCQNGWKIVSKWFISLYTNLVVIKMTLYHLETLR